MAGAGDFLGWMWNADWFAAAVINFRKMVAPDEQDWKGIRFSCRGQFLDSLGEAEITECIRIPLRGISSWQRERRRTRSGRPACGSVLQEEKIRELWDAGADRIVYAAEIGRKVLPGSGYIQRCVSGDPGQRKLWPETSVCQYEKSGHSVRFRSF